MNLENKIESFKDLKFFINRNRKSLFHFFALFLTALVLLGIGYKAEYSSRSFLIYSTTLVIWICYYTYYNLKKGSITFSFFSWFAFLLFHPKQIMYKNGRESIFSIGFANNSFELSFFDILHPILTLPLLIFVLRNHRKINKKILTTSCLFIFIASINTFLLSNGSSAPTLKSFIDLTYYSNAIILINFIQLIRLQSFTYYISFIFRLLGLILSAEYILGKFSFSYPLLKYSFDYRNAFKSSFFENEMMMGCMAVFLCTSLTIGILKSKSFIDIILFLIINFLMFETFSRSVWLPFSISIIMILLINRKIIIPIAYILTINFVFIPISMETSMISANTENQINFWYYEPNANGKDRKRLHYIYQKGLASSNSLKDRLGLITRSMEIFAANPILGIGAANTPYNMSNKNIPQLSISKKLTGDAKNFYEKVYNNKHFTNTHNYYIHALSEFGLSILLFIYPFLLIIFQFIKRTVIEIKVKNISSSQLYFIAPLAILGFYAFQATPLTILPLFIIFLKLSTEDDSPIATS